MINSSKEAKAIKKLFKIHKVPELQSSYLILGWREDAGKLGVGVIDFLNKELGSEEFAQIEPLNFFSLSEVAVTNNIVQFPEGKFYSCKRSNLITFKSDLPSHEWYKFTNLILDIAERFCHIKEVYTIGGILSLIAHTSPRRISTVVNQPELKEILQNFRLETDMDYKTPPGGVPTLSSYLLWVAKRRDIAGVNLWGEVPFYFVEEDLRSRKRMLLFLDSRFNLGLDLKEIELKIEEQNEGMAELRREDTEINKYIEMLERGIMLSQDEGERLTIEVTRFLRKRSWS